MRRRIRLAIHREDHSTDSLGRLFLDHGDRERSLALLREYLGPQARLKSAELADDIVRMEVDIQDFEQESRNLLRMGREASKKGRERAALGHLVEALKLAPWSLEALKALGRLYYRKRQRSAARELLVRAREVEPADVDVLGLLAEIALHDDRRLAARSYLGELERLDPGNPRIQSTLSRLLPEDAQELRRQLHKGATASSGLPPDES